MKPYSRVLLGIALTACGDDGPGLTDSSTGASTGASDSTGNASASEGVDGGSTTDDEPVDPRPILEREPLITHACEETRAMEQPVGAASGRSEALVTVGGEHFVLRSSGTLTLTNIALDGTMSDELVLEPEIFTAFAPTSAAIDAGIATVWTYTGGASWILRYAVVDEALGTVVAPKDLTGIPGAPATAAALVPAASGELALFYGESDDAGQTRLRLVSLDASGDPTTTPVDVADVGPLYGKVSASAAITSDGGYAVSYVAGDVDQGEVFFVILEADGTQRFAPQRLSRAAADGWSSDLGARRRSLLAVGEEFWIVLTAGQPNPPQTYLDTVVELAIADAQGHSERHLLKAPVDGKHDQWPSLVALDDRVGLLWTTGNTIMFCVACVSDDDLQLVLLDPEAVVPASNVAIQPHLMNGIVAPLGAFVGADMLTVASLDFHAATLPASGSMRCEPTG